jgi:hypothetical protein
MTNFGTRPIDAPPAFPLPNSTTNEARELKRLHKAYETRYRQLLSLEQSFVDEDRAIVVIQAELDGEVTRAARAGEASVVLPELRRKLETARLAANDEDRRACLAATVELAQHARGAYRAHLAAHAREFNDLLLAEAEELRAERIAHAETGSALAVRADALAARSLAITDGIARFDIAQPSFGQRPYRRRHGFEHDDVPTRDPYALPIVTREQLEAAKPVLVRVPDAAAVA